MKTHDDDQPRVDVGQSQTGRPTGSTAASNEAMPSLTNTPWNVVRDSHGRVMEIAGPCFEHPSCRKTVVFQAAHQWGDDGHHSSAECPCEANARLIAASPELLWACKDALGTITHHPDWKDEQSRWPVRQTIELLRAAIAKAEAR